MLGLFSGFPDRRFPDEIAARLKAELPVRNSLVFVSAWPADHDRNDDDSAGMHGMFAERDMAFARFCVIDERTEPAEAQRLLREADCIFLMGGNATAQMQLMRDKGLPDVIRNSRGVILGVSAGSMNMGKTTVDIWENLVPYEGLGLTDITMIGHFSYEDTERLELMKAVSMERPVCAMEDESAIFIKGGRADLAGAIHRIERGEIEPFSREDVRL